MLAVVAVKAAAFSFVTALMLADGTFEGVADFFILAVTLVLVASTAAGIRAVVEQRRGRSRESGRPVGLAAGTDGRAFEEGAEATAELGT